MARDTINFELLRLKDDSLLDSDNLKDPALIAAEIAAEIAVNLPSDLEQMEAILVDLEPAGLEPADSV